MIAGSHPPDFDTVSAASLRAGHFFPQIFGSATGSHLHWPKQVSDAYKTKSWFQPRVANHEDKGIASLNLKKLFPSLKCIQRWLQHQLWSKIRPAGEIPAFPKHYRCCASQSSLVSPLRSPIPIVKKQKSELEPVVSLSM